MEMFEYLNELQVAGEKLINSYEVLVMITLFLSWVASFAAILLMILDRTKWKLYSNDMLPQLLAPYLFSSLPHIIFHFLRIGFGKWIALLTVVLRLFLPNHFSESLEIPGATILLIVTTPNDLVAMFRDDWRDIRSVCFYTSWYFLIKHTKACGSFKNSFTQKDKVTYTICLWVMLVYPIWSALAYFFK